MSVISEKEVPWHSLHCFPYLKVHITSVGTLNVCNLWILLRKIVNVVFMYFFAVKADGSDVKSGISLHENLFTDSPFDVTSVNFNS